MQFSGFSVLVVELVKTHRSIFNKFTLINSSYFICINIASFLRWLSQPALASVYVGYFAEYRVQNDR